MKLKVRPDRSQKPPRGLAKRRARPAPEAAAPSAAAPAPDKVELRPYGPQIRISRLSGVLLTLGALGFCFMYGLVFAFFAPYLMMQMALPIVVLAALVLWALPETGRAPVRYLEGLVVLYLIAHALWPNYLAVALPGLPWITVLRLLGVALALVLLTSISVSKSFRARLAGILRTAPWLSRPIFLFALIQAVSIFFSVDRGASANLYLNVLTGWICPFVATCLVCAKDGRAERFAGLFCVVAIILSGLTVWEHRLGHVPWLGHIPRFLQVNDPNVQRFLAGTDRTGGGHRAQATFTTSLALSEYLALTLPFLLHFGAVRYPKPLRIAAFAGVPFVIWGILLTQARTGMIGVLVAVFLYPIARVFLYWRRNPQSLAASSVLFLSPVGVAVGLLIAYVVPGLHVRIFGNGATAYSNDSRNVQIQMGMPKIFGRPWGYGIGEGSDTLQYSGAFSSVYSIDVYPLRLALEYGIVGFVLYYIIMAAGIFYPYKYITNSEKYSKERMLFIPIGVIVISYTLMQFVFALEDNQTIVFATYGMLVAMVSRYANRARSFTAFSHGKNMTMYPSFKR